MHPNVHSARLPVDQWWVELMFAAQGLEFRRPAKCSKIIEENHAVIRSKVAKLEDDRLIGKDMLAIAELINERKFVVNF